MVTTVADIIKIMETVAPVRLAEEWDNVGLQVGQENWPVRNIWVALDPLYDVVEAACRHDVDLLITHHPLIFQPLRSIDFNTKVGSIIQMATRSQLAIFTAHTNLDIVADGLNDILASRIGLSNLKVLGKIKTEEVCKFVVFVPVEHEQKVLNSLFETQAGQIGSYTCCSFRNSGKGTFKPGSSSKPFIGERNEISHADEIRIETVVRMEDLASVIEHVRKKHPYETMAYDVYPLSIMETDFMDIQGIGRVGDLDKTIEFLSFTRMVKEKLGLESVKVAGRPDLRVTRVAVCAGSGSSLMSAFISSGAQVYISGDLRYHDAREVEAADLGLIDIGHFASEYIVIETLANRLTKVLTANDMDVKVEACKLEKDPFTVL